MSALADRLAKALRSSRDDQPDIHDRASSWEKLEAAFEIADEAVVALRSQPNDEPAFILCCGCGDLAGPDFNEGWNCPNCVAATDAAQQWVSDYVLKEVGIGEQSVASGHKFFEGSRRSGGVQVTVTVEATAPPEAPEVTPP